MSVALKPKPMLPGAAAAGAAVALAATAAVSATSEKARSSFRVNDISTPLRLVPVMEGCWPCRDRIKTRTRGGLTERR